MSKKIVFEGAATALITPFKNGEIDYDTLARLIEMQISAGIDAIVIGGTTAEAATLSDEERYKLYAYAFLRGNLERSSRRFDDACNYCNG